MASPVNKHAVNELVLFIENDSQLYHSRYQPICKNYAKRVFKGQFSIPLAVKGVISLVDSGLIKYRRDRGMEGAREYGLGKGVSAATKEAAAKIILRGMTEEIRDNVKKMKAGGK